MTEAEEKFLDQVTDAGMSLADLREFNKDRRMGDTISPSEWMKAKDLPETEREKARNIRISEANKKNGVNQYVDDKFDPPGMKAKESPWSPASQMKKLKKPKI